MDVFKTFGDESVEKEISFNIDFKDWQKKLTKQEKIIFSHLIKGYKAKDISDILQLTYTNL